VKIEANSEKCMVSTGPTWQVKAWIFISGKFSCCLILWFDSIPWVACSLDFRLFPVEVSPIKKKIKSSYIICCKLFVLMEYTLDSEMYTDSIIKSSLTCDNWNCDLWFEGVKRYVLMWFWSCSESASLYTVIGVLHKKYVCMRDTVELKFLLHSF
jgi:hypothetical protein